MACSGFGFYLLHSCIQVHVTDLSQTARGAAASLHSSSFYLGQALGPIVYGFGFAHGGPEPTIFFGAVVVLAVGIVCSRMLRRRTCMNRTLNIVSFLIFASALSVRAIDPVVPQIAADFSISTTTAALLAAAFAAYGLAQPVLGPMADAFGKARMMIACLSAARRVVVPLRRRDRLLAAVRPAHPRRRRLRRQLSRSAWRSISDFVPLAQRQVMIGRLLTATISGNLLGAAAAGIVADVIHWRGMFVILGVISTRGAAARLFRPARSAANARGIRSTSARC